MFNNVTSKKSKKYLELANPNRKESLDLSIFVQKYTIFKYFCYTLYLSD